jgi:hypothetical protein
MQVSSISRMTDQIGDRCQFLNVITVNTVLDSRPLGAPLSAAATPLPNFDCFLRLLTQMSSQPN